jgi:osmotically-inducible protein OsmY
MRILSVILGFPLLLGLAACSPSDQERAKEQARENGRELSHEAKVAGEEIKKDAKDLSRQVDAAVQPRLDHAALVAKVKSKLASDAGLSTLSHVEVDADGSVVTLSGTVTNETQKRAAEIAAAKVDGVSRVENRLVVR